ncbi:UDP-glucose:glycoprotein glucosyltransferase-domain-containing protein [Dipodascopsis tothii]|uniref:UDP-glucose:glycoprotein glucosyltransferase-domain-containing protein n=1 Tax=Dipodascopsis tothii TaxID=44089 RepID=UPI0034CD5CC4
MKLLRWTAAAAAVAAAACPAAAAPGVAVDVAVPWTEPSPFAIEVAEAIAAEAPAAFFPVLVRLAEQAADADEPLTHQAVHAAALDAALDGLVSPAATSWIEAGLALRRTSARVQAAYQYYRDTHGDGPCGQAGSWLTFNDEPVCDPAAVFALRTPGRLAAHTVLPFDREFAGAAGPGAPVAVLYADVASPEFLAYHSSLAAEAAAGRLRYVLRYKPSDEAPVARGRALAGYGAELALKRTDYIVRDDRVVAEQRPAAPAAAAADDLLPTGADIAPLAASELAGLAARAAAFVRAHPRPLDALVQLAQDLPKYASALAAVEADPAPLLAEAAANAAAAGMAPGDAAVYVNGARLDPVLAADAFSVLEAVDRDRQLVDELRALGANASAAARLLASEPVAAARAHAAEPRFDYRDAREGGGVISWVNDLEADPRYGPWPTSLSMLLRPHYPGQFHNIRRRIHTVVVPVDLTAAADLFSVVNHVGMVADRGVALMFGLVPFVDTPEQVEQARFFLLLREGYGMPAAMRYLQFCLDAGRGGDRGLYEAARPRFAPEPDAAVLATVDSLVERSRQWLTRLGARANAPVVFANGVAVPRADNWLQAAAMKADGDIDGLAAAVAAGTLGDDDDVQAALLADAHAERSVLVFGAAARDDRHIDLGGLLDAYGDVVRALPTLEHTPEPASPDTVWLWLVADFDTAAGAGHLRELLQYLASRPPTNVRATLVHAPVGKHAPGLSALLHRLAEAHALSALRPEDLHAAVAGADGLPLDEAAAAEAVLGAAKLDGWAAPDKAAAAAFWQAAAPVAARLGRASGDLVVLNSRVLRVPAGEALRAADVAAFVAVELAARVRPALAAARALGLLPAAADYERAGRLTSVAVKATRPATAHAFFQPTVQRAAFFDRWNRTHSSFDVGDYDAAGIRVVAILDPATEYAQKTGGLLQLLAGLDGVGVRVFLNPEPALEQMPVTRFYRSVLPGRVRFDSAGGLVEPRVDFAGVPTAPLYTLGLDVPAAWLVAPSRSAADLDNILLADGGVDATYTLTSILIEGHARDVTTGGPPRGAEVELSTPGAPAAVADTIVMANVGYFQFKAGPGVWQVGIKPGASARVFRLASGAARETVYVTALTGATVFPALARNRGFEAADVLAVGADTGVVARARALWGRVRGGPAPPTINIFSVASGHLYERFLSIMTASVMRHTDHTVKFWLIENFLSPSFKDFLPRLAARYGFQYELVTYKWPRWLRGQKEKQREIWGYKILFLDVLFPLDLKKVIFVDADQIVRADLQELVDLDLGGAPYGYTPMCDSRTEIEGFRFWKKGYWRSLLKQRPYHISALYVVDLDRFRQLAAGDRLRQQYQQLSADPGSLANLDQDLPNYMQLQIPIFSLPQDWLWCETWCSDESLATAKTIDLCQNPMTKEPKLDRARRQIPEWTAYDDEIAALQAAAPRPPAHDEL